MTTQGTPGTIMRAMKDRIPGLRLMTSMRATKAMRATTKPRGAAGTTPTPTIAP